MSPELDKIMKEADNPVEAFFAGIIYCIVEFVFRILEVFIEITQESH